MARIQQFLYLPNWVADQRFHVLCWKRHGQQVIRDVAHVQVVASRNQSSPLLGHQAAKVANDRRANGNIGLHTGIVDPILLAQFGPRRDQPVRSCLQALPLGLSAAALDISSMSLYVTPAFSSSGAPERSFTLLQNCTNAE